MIKVLRIEQWTKNLIIFLPLVLSKNFEVLTGFKIYIIFLFFSILVSSTYIFNDIRDVDQDMNHPDKKYRPIASGLLSVSKAKKYGFFLLMLSSSIISFISLEIFYLSIVYIILTTTYSLKTKYIKYLDFLSITFLFGIRMLIGSVIGETELSNFFLLFVLSFLTQIALGKKLSIFNNIKIDNSSKLKRHLQTSYKDRELLKILNYTSFFSCIIFTLWSIQKSEAYTYELFLSSISVILLIFISKKFKEDSKLSKCENFISWVVEPKIFCSGLIISVIVVVISF